MIVWTILAALESDCFDRILVSTDSEEIAEVSISAGASVPFLRQQGADDEAPSSLATIGAVKQAEAYWRTRFDRIAQLMPNCPLRDVVHVRAAMDNFQRLNVAYQISCFRLGWMNPWWAVKLDVDMTPTRLFPEALSKRSQDLEHLYCPSGAIWIAGRDSLLEAGTFYGPGHRFFPMDWIGAVDIDDMDDYRMALSLARVRREGQS